MPETFVLMGLNSPRMLLGASGLGSQISMWLGPPCKNTRITDFAELNPCAPSRREAPRAFCHWKKFARFKPNRPTEPTRSSSRRVGPSHKQPLRPGIVSIETLLRRQRKSLTPETSSVVQKRLAIDQRPEQILRPSSVARAAFQKSQGRVIFLGSRIAAQRRQVQIFDDCAIGCAGEN